MSLTVETGSGVNGADSYASLATIDAYWTARPHNALSTTWSAGVEANKEGAAREASAYLDAVYGEHYRGYRRGRIQGLLWPRSAARDEAGYDLPDLPDEVVNAVCELAARALSERLLPDEDRGNQVERERKKVGPIEVDTTFTAGAQTHKRYGVVDGMLAPVLKGSQPGAPTQWTWSA